MSAHSERAVLREPPHSVEAEQSVLGAMMLDNAVIGDVIGTLPASDFYSGAHQEVFQHVAQLHREGTPVDVVTLTDRLTASRRLEYIGGKAYLGKLIEGVPTAANVQHYVRIVRERALRRGILAVVADVAQAASAPGTHDADTVLDDAREKLDALAVDGACNAWPAPIDLETLAERSPEAPKFIMADWLPVGYATLLAGHGGVGKSAIGLTLSVCIATGTPFFGVAVERRRVLYLSCEDRVGVLHWRLSNVCAHLGIDMASLRGWLDVLDLVGHDVILWERDPQSGNTVTPAFVRLRQRMVRSHRQVLIVDGVSDTFAGNENSRADVKRYVNALLSVVPADDGALLLLGHVAKPIASNPSSSEGYSGSTQWHNAVRARWYLYPELVQDENDRPQRSGRLQLELQKSNLGAVTPAMSFRWDDAARMFVGEASIVGGGIVDSIRERGERVAILRALLACATAGISVPAAMQGPRTAYFVLSERPEFPESLRGGTRPKTRRFARHVEALRQSRFITESSIRRSNRHLLATLDVTPEGRAECANS